MGFHRHRLVALSEHARQGLLDTAVSKGYATTTAVAAAIP